ncbi:other/FunK1 protein kinase [Coprinopsis cinerea AmutBmut pab1-1]|nr:other/FunK1 protein kinase [Coprinopsis cinerea AmutBmut pab1-1]
MASDYDAIEIDNFLARYLPNHLSKSFDALVADLKKQKILVPRSRSSDPSSSSPTDKRTPYTHFLKPFKTAFQAGSPRPSRVLKSLQVIAKCVGNALRRFKWADVNEFYVREDTVCDDTSEASLTRRRDGTLGSTDIAVPMSILAVNGNEPDHSRFTSRLLRVLNEDARRKFVYGITFQGADISFWCLSRSHVVRSIPLNVLEHSDVLIHALSSLLSSPEHLLGYDPLVTLLPDGSYIYALPPESARMTPLFYQTVELVSQFHSSVPGGRTSRIWKVRQVASPTDSSPIPGATELILKDATLDARVPTEADNQQQLFNDIAAFAKDDDWRTRQIVKEFTAHDLDVLSDAFQGDNFKRYFACIIASHAAEPCTIAGGDLTPNSSNAARRRCFFIFDSICTPLYDIPTLGDAMDILIQSLTALQLMFCAGWVHRDVSAGNILAVRSSAPGGRWQVKLSDLEYARKFPVEGAVQDEQKTGTPYFMACELLSLQYFIRINYRKGERRPPPKPVVHNYQHDLEAIWWIALWLATVRVKSNRPCPMQVRHFRNSVSYGYGIHRGALFMGDHDLAQDPLITNTIPRSVPTAFIDSLDELRNNLQVEYHSRNGAGKQEDPAAYSWILSDGFTVFLEGIEECREEWAGIELFVESELRRQRQAECVQPPPPPTKRKPEDEDQPRPEGDDRLADQQRPKKKVRVAPTSQGPARRTGPVTRSMTRNQMNTGPVTRATTRRLQESKAKGATTSRAVASNVKTARR